MKYKSVSYTNKFWGNLFLNFSALNHCVSYIFVSMVIMSQYSLKNWRYSSVVFQSFSCSINEEISLMITYLVVERSTTYWYMDWNA